jgi:type I restriction enzyme M protein
MMAKRQSKRVPDSSATGHGPALLTCPIRGQLSVTALAKDGLTVTEEARRIDFLHFLLNRKYPATHIAVETVILKKLGESGRNKLRCDVIVYEEPSASLAHLSLEKRLSNALIVAEIKRDSKSKSSGVDCQLEPAMRLLPGLQVMGAYWDNVERLLFIKELVKKNGNEYIDVRQDSLENLPRFGGKYAAKAITLDQLSPPKDLVAILFSVANAMRSHGINDEHIRYSETVKLILARYCDEREAADSSSKELSLQVLAGKDPEFMDRLNRCYKLAAKRYHRAKTLFSPQPGPRLSERALRDIVKRIQGVRFLTASNEAMQQVFMSFVPAVFKKSLNQYFTPLPLIETMVDMVHIGPNDKVADPGMGTAEFLTTTCEFRNRAGDLDIEQRIFGMDIDERAYELVSVAEGGSLDGEFRVVASTLGPP